MYKLYLKISKTNENVNTIFISPVALSSDFDIALNKHYAGQGAVFCVWLFSCSNSMSSCQKAVSETKYYLSTAIECSIFLSLLMLLQRITISVFL